MQETKVITCQVNNLFIFKSNPLVINLLPLHNKKQCAYQDFEKDGWYEVRQKGSHIIMKHPTKKNIVPVPFHGAKEMKKGTLRSIFKLAEIETSKR